MDNLSTYLLAFNFPYLAIFAIVFLSGIILFIVPEEIFLLAIGYFAYLGLINLYIAILVSFLAVLCSENVIYLISRKYGSFFINSTSKYLRVIKKIESYGEEYFNKHGEKTVFISRFFPTLRFSAPIVAGVFKMSWKNFFIYNFLGVIIWVPLVIFLSYHVGIGFEMATGIKELRHVVYAIVISFFSFFILRKIYKLYKTR